MPSSSPLHLSRIMRQDDMSLSDPLYLLSSNERDRARGEGELLRTRTGKCLVEKQLVRGKVRCHYGNKRINNTRNRGRRIILFMKFT